MRTKKNKLENSAHHFGVKYLTKSFRKISRQKK